MSHKIANRVIESSTSTGTGPMALSPVTAYRRFADRMAIADTCWYLIEAVDANGAPTGAWELGRGTYTAANTLSRTTVIESSNANALVNFGTGKKNISMPPLAPDAVTAEDWRNAMGIDVLFADVMAALAYQALSTTSNNLRLQTQSMETY